MMEPVAHPIEPVSFLAVGDALARRGDWLAACDAWDQALQQDARYAAPVRRRLSWFLTETGSPSGRFRSRLFLVATFSATALVATLFVAVAGTPGSSAANAWAMAAWAMILVSMVAAILAAWPAREESLESLLERSRSIASEMRAVRVKRDTR